MKSFINKKNMIILITMFFAIIAIVSFLNVSYSGNSIPPTNTVDNTSFPDYNSTDDCIPRSNDSNALFERIGKYAFATAGNNNAYRGTSHGAGDGSWIQSYPSSVSVPYNWNTVSANLANAGISSFSNMSGSYLHANGKIVKAYLAMLSSTEGNENTTGAYHGRVLIIKPSGSYNIIRVDYSGWNSVIDITNYIKDDGEGWYFISFLDAVFLRQTAWGIAAIYENNSLPISHIKFINVNTEIYDGREKEVAFDSVYEIKDNLQMVGIITSGGISGFPNYDSGYAGGNTTQDRAWVKLSNGTLFQLYDRGDGHFNGRSNIDFANNTFNTTRSHSIPGGELDIFDETFTKDYFGGYDLKGFKFKKDGGNNIHISVVGLRQEVKAPTMSITTQITPHNEFRPTTEMNITTTVVNSLNPNDGLCYSAYNNVITSSVHSDLGTPYNIVVTYNREEYVGIYDPSTRKISAVIGKIDCDKPVEITYNAIAQNSMIDHMYDNKFHLNTTATATYAIKYCEDPEVVITANDAAEAPAPSKLTVHHYVVEPNGTRTEIEACPTQVISTETTPVLGQSYEANACTSFSPDYYYYDGEYVIVAGEGTYNSAANKITGTYTIPKERGGTIINFYYERKPAQVVTNHLIETSRDQVPGCNPTLEDTYQGLQYSTSSCSATGYTLIGVDTSYDPASGTVSRALMSIIYIYRPSSATLIIHHCKEGYACSNSSPSGQLHADDVYTDYHYGDTYPLPLHGLPSYHSPEELNDTGYEWNRTLPDNYQGIITTSPTEITYYYKLRKGNLIVHHYLKGTETSANPEKLCENYQENDIPYGRYYQTSKCSQLEALYEDAICSGANNVVPWNATGYINAPLTEVTYCYSHRLSNVYTHHYLQRHDGTKTTIKVHDDVNQIGLFYGTTYETQHLLSEDLDCDRTHDSTCSTTTSTGLNYRNRYDYYEVQDGDSPSAVIDRNTYNINYYYSPKPTNLVVHHYKEGTTESLCDSITDNDAYYDKTISYDKCNNLSDSNYRFKRVSTNVSDDTVTVDGSSVTGFINQDYIEIVYEYERIPTSYTVHHYLEESYIPVGQSAPVKVYDDEVTEEIRYGQSYETSSKNTSVLYERYRNMYQYTGHIVGTASGIISSDNMVITYYYEPIEVDVITHHLDKRNSGSIVHANDEQHLRYGDNYTTQTYGTAELDGDYKNTYSYTGVSYGDPISGTLNTPKSNNQYDIYYEYDMDKAAYIVHHYICGTTTQVSPDIRRTENFGGAYSTNKIESSGLSGIYKDNYEYSTVTTTDTNATVNIGAGTTSGIFNQNRIEITYCYVPKKANVIAHYKVCETNEVVHADIIQSNLDFGTDYGTRQLAASELEGTYKDNYVYSRLADNTDPASGRITKNPIEVTYCYLRDPIILSTRHHIKGTSIDVSSTLCPETNEELNRRDSYDKYKCSNLPAGYQFDSVRSNDSATVLDQTNGRASGTISRSTTITFEYSLIGIGLTVQYYDIDTGEKFDQYDKFLSKTYGDTVLERPININNYQYVSVEVDTGDATNSEYSITANTGVVNGIIRKNTTIKYYYRHALDLVVHHYKNGTTTSICEDEYNRVNYNSAYEKNPCEDKLRLGQYQYVDVVSNDNTTVLNKDTGQATGTIKNNVTIIYYYDIPTVVPQPTKTGTQQIDSRDEVVEYNLVYVADIQNYVGPATYTLVDKLPYPLAENDSRIDLAGGVYDASTKTIVWTFSEHVNTGRNGSIIKRIEKNIKLVYKDIPATVTKINNKFNTTTELDGFMKETENEFETTFKLYTLTVSHRNERTDEEIALCPRETTENLNYGYHYQTQPCQTIGSEYTLKSIKELIGVNKVDGSASGEITKDTTIIYYYDLTKYNYTVKHLDVDTNEELIPTRVENIYYGTSYDEGTIEKDRYQFDHLYVSDENATRTENHVTGTVHEDTEITFFYKKYQTIHIIHKDIDTGEILNEETKEIAFRDTYEEYKKDFNKYKFVDVTSDDTETLIEEDKASGIIEKDINLVYRYKKQLNLVTNHYMKGTTEPICTTENEVLPYNTAYEKHKCENDDLLGQYIYAYVESNSSDSNINDPEGIVTGSIHDDTVINYYYELTEITNNPDKTGPELVHSRSKAFNYTITDNVSLKDYRGDATITVVDKLDYPIDTTKSNIGNGIYDPDNLTITWIIAWNDINTNGKPNDTVTKNVSIEYTLYYLDVPQTALKLTNRVEVTVHTEKVDDTDDDYIDTTLDPFKLIVHHYKEGTTQELCPTTTELLDEDTVYTKSICNLDEYDYIEVKKNGTKIPNNPETVTEPITGDTILDFIYRKKDSTLETILTKKGPDELTSIYQEQEYDIHYEGHVVDYRGNGVITITDTLPYRIDTNRSNLDGGEYDGEYKIVWTVNWNDIDTYNGKNDTIKVDKKITVVYLDVNVDRKIMTNEVEAKTVLNDKTDLVTATKEIDINLPGQIIVHHYITGTTDRLFDDDEETGLVHEKYHCQPHEKEGYYIVTRPDREDIEFTLEPQVLVYEYDKYKYNIVTENIGGSGTITGDEEVYYDDDSTEDNIVIIPDEGYEIERVIIDGVEIEVPDRDKMIVTNFKQVRAPHLVQVEFTEKPIEVPITGRKTKLIIVSIILVLINILFAIKTDFFKKILKRD